MKRALVSVIALLLLSSVVCAEEGVLVKNVPAHVDTQVVLNLVKKAFIIRGWQITSSDASSIAASIEEHVSNAHMRVTLEQGRLVYTGGATIATPSQGFGPRAHMRIPRTWLKNLRLSIEGDLATIPAP